MRVKNTTSIPNEVVKEVIKFVRPSGISNFDVMIKNGESLAGKAYCNGSTYHSNSSPFVVCRLPEFKKVMNRSTMAIVKKDKYPCKMTPYQYGHLKGRRYWLADRVEALVYLLAHELRHLWQAKMKNKKGYYPKSRGRFSEIDTEGYAITKLRAWRNRS